VLLGLIAYTSAQTTPVTLPQAFQTDWTVAFEGINNDFPLFKGRFAIDYNKLGAYWSVEDDEDTNVPYQFDTSIIGVPIPGTELLQGFQFLQIGRCWTINNMTEENFHIIPLGIPSSASFLGNLTYNGYQCGSWQWPAYDYLLTLSMIARWSDGGILRFVVDSDILFPFKMTLENTAFIAHAGPDNWQTPAGPCPQHVGIFPSPSPFSFKGLLDMWQGLKSTHAVMSDFFLDGSRVSKRVAPTPTKSSPRAPTPPTLHQFFSSDYVLGWGIIEAKSNWVPPNDIFRGHIAFDKTRGGLYMEISDNQDADVPWTFQTSFISHPYSVNNVTGFMFLENGRCWSAPYTVVNPSFPLKIPDDAVYGGQHTVWNSIVELWSFPYTVEYISVEVTVAVVVKDLTISFINLVADYSGSSGNTYFTFQKFNTTQPSVRNYAVPPGPCTPVLGQ